MGKERKEDKTQIGLKDATVDQLKVGAFDIDQQIKGFQQQYQMILEELKERYSSTEQPLSDQTLIEGDK